MSATRRGFWHLLLRHCPRRIIPDTRLQSQGTDHTDFVHDYWNYLNETKWRLSYQHHPLDPILGQMALLQPSYQTFSLMLFSFLRFVFQNSVRHWTLQHNGWHPCFKFDKYPRYGPMSSSAIDMTYSVIIFHSMHESTLDRIIHF